MFSVNYYDELIKHLFRESVFEIFCHILIFTVIMAEVREISTCVRIVIYQC